jgi:hypothetical protein
MNWPNYKLTLCSGITFTNDYISLACHHCHLHHVLYLTTTFAFHLLTTTKCSGLHNIGATWFWFCQTELHNTTGHDLHMSSDWTIKHTWMKYTPCLIQHLPVILQPLSAISHNIMLDLFIKVFQFPGKATTGTVTSYFFRIKARFHTCTADIHINSMYLTKIQENRIKKWIHKSGTDWKMSQKKMRRRWTVWYKQE